MIDLFGFLIPENLFFSSSFIVVSTTLIGFLISVLIYIEALKKGFKSKLHFIFWSIVILFVPWGSIIYYTLFHNQKEKNSKLN